MSMLNSFFNQGFKAARCKTLLKLTIPRIKLLRNRREIQIKQMRRDIAKLLETGQEATARIRVEHIIREEKMIAAQEIIELFCELITARLLIIETQRECPLDLKEAISSVCFAAPRCADLPELLQFQMLLASKYGKEFVSAATELMPECGVNRQLVELLSVRAPAADVKLKMLKEIAEEHDLDWDPAASETEFLKPHEDLLNGPTQFVSGPKLPLSEEEQDESLCSAVEQVPNKQSDSDPAFNPSDFPEVPKESLKPSVGTAPALEMLPFPLPPLPEVNKESPKKSETNENLSHESHTEPAKMLQKETVVPNECEPPNISVGPVEDKQFLPFISPPPLSSESFSARQSDPPPSIPRIKINGNIDLQDILAAAQTAAEMAELAATAARSAANLAQVRISEVVKKKDDENLFHADPCQSGAMENPYFDHQNSRDDSGDASNTPSPRQENHPSYANPKVETGSPISSEYVLGHDTTLHQPQRLNSMDNEVFFSYPNLFVSKDSNLESGVRPLADDIRTTHEL
ncbi:uncharacterized protein LOC132274238 [Cornus florida]|uniref:uncharacterized protein LOC132274238 n=1 Tax=Cornus florida TaxID=4283 RepID=UPI00289C0E97|nr:uncharacterized protein LOC132274238 [Cornus florida]